MRRRNLKGIEGGCFIKLTKERELQRRKNQVKIGKKEALEDDPKGKQILGKRKHVEEESEGDSSESGSEGDSS
ncbi:hypothetical protein PIB30_056525 [Stylosanthes scabra]|uniref:Uncharacterized protein n=1 Tax=Stylosanthes scabra TaxID=79078 RepID=A0ABU6QK57_9FABA|nr:hypothetical protein [Stylosanthes scabra]